MGEPQTKQEWAQHLDGAMNSADGLYDEMDTLLRYLCESNGINPDDFEFSVTVTAKED